MGTPAMVAGTVDVQANVYAFIAFVGIAVIAAVVVVIQSVVTACDCCPNLLLLEEALGGGEQAGEVDAGEEGEKAAEVDVDVQPEDGGKAVQGNANNAAPVGKSGFASRVSRIRFNPKATFGRLMTQMAIIVPIFMNTAQAMALYFEAWEFPTLYVHYFRNLFYMFSLDLDFIPAVPVWVTIVVQYAVCFAAIAGTIRMAAIDDVEFREQVVEHIKDHGLGLDGHVASESLPEAVRMPMPVGAPMHYTVAGRMVVGLRSRETLQMALKRVIEQLPAKRPTVLFLEGRPFSCCGDEDAYLREFYDAVVVDHKMVEVQNLLQLLGFPLIGTTGIVTVYRDCYLNEAHGMTKAVMAAEPEKKPGPKAAWGVATGELDDTGGTEPAESDDYWSLGISGGGLDSARSGRAGKLGINNTSGGSKDDVKVQTYDDLRSIVSFVHRYYHVALDLDMAARIAVKRGLKRKKAIFVHEAAEDFQTNLKLKRAQASSDEEFAQMQAELEGWLATQEARDFDAEYRTEAEALLKRLTWLSHQDALVMEELGLTAEWAERRGSFAWCLRDLMPHLGLEEFFRMIVGLLVCDEGFAPEDRVSICTLHHLMQCDYVGSFTRDLFVRNFGLNARSSLSRHDELRDAQVYVGNPVLQQPVASSERSSPGATEPIRDLQLPDYSFQPVRADGTPDGEAMAVEPLARLTHCPFHDLRLFPGLEEVHHKVRRDATKYPCGHRNNAVYQTSVAPRIDEDLPLKPCDFKTFFVCPDDSCGFSICSTHYHGNGLDWLLAKAAMHVYALKRRGLLSLVGLLVILVAQSMYMPSVHGAMTVVFCHVSIACQFPTCYFPATPGFMVMAVASTFVLLLVGFGLVAFLWVSVYRRKKLLLSSGVLDGFVVLGNTRMPKNQELTFFTVLKADCPIPVWEAVVDKDSTMLRPLYEQYEFRNMCLHPVTFLFKGALLLCVLYGGEPNGLSIIVWSAIVETVQLLMYVSMDPFLSPWIDLLGKSGSIHQVAQLGLVCWHRALTFRDPKDLTAMYVMLGVSSMYFTVVIVVIVFVVVIPACTKDENEEAADVPAKVTDEKKIDPVSEDKYAAVAAEEGGWRK